MQSLILLLLLALPSYAYDAAAGKRLYLQNCAKCHGAEGKGDGPASVRLEPRPRDLTSGLYKVRSTPSGSLASVDDVVATLTRGMPASSMPSFSGVLTPAEMGDVAAYILSLPAEGDWKREGPVSIGVRVSSSSAGITRGAAVYAKLRCAECHGAGGRGDGRSAKLLTGEFGLPTRPADLTAPWTFKGGRDSADLVMRLSAGIDNTPMPSYQDQTTMMDRWDLAHYILSLRRTPPWELGPAEFTAHQSARWKTKEERGRYLARTMTCGLCHTQTRVSDGSYIADRELAGGVKFVSYPFGVYHSKNLTPAIPAGIGNWSEADIVKLLTEGTRPDHTRISFNAMPWAFFSDMAAEDLEALAAHLKTLKPSGIQPAANTEFVYFENIGYKLAHLFLGQPATLDIHSGDAPYTAGDVPAQRRRMAYYAFFGGVVLLLIAAGALLQVAFNLKKRWQQAVMLAGAVGVLVAGAAGYAVLYMLPPLDILPPKHVSMAVLGGIPSPKPADARIMPTAMRGMSLVKANCAMCHTAAPMVSPPDAKLTLAGGTKVTHPAFGTRYARNLTPDLETGLGQWTFNEIMRAVKSGVARDGRHIHWLDMPWDRFSNMDDEDLAAIAIYLKSIPPVRHKIPEPEPPSPDDPPVFSIYSGNSGKLIH